MQRREKKKKKIEKYKKEKQIEDAKWLKKKEEMKKSNEEEREKKQKEEEQKKTIKREEDGRQTIMKEKERQKRKEEEESQQEKEIGKFKLKEKKKILSHSAEGKSENAVEKIGFEEERLKRLAEEMKKMEEDLPKLVSKPPSQTQSKPPKPVCEKIPVLKESSKPASVVTVDSNSFMPKKNRKSEVQVLKIGSPSQIRKAVMCEVKMEQPLENIGHTESNSAGSNYQISKIPTTVFEFKKPTPKSDQTKSYAITKVPTTHTNIEMEKLSKTYAENVAKYSETKPIRKRSESIPRPPPPSFKPPPPPPIY